MINFQIKKTRISHFCSDFTIWSTSSVLSNCKIILFIENLDAVNVCIQLKNILLSSVSVTNRAIVEQFDCSSLKGDKLKYFLFFYFWHHYFRISLYKSSRKVHFKKCVNREIGKIKFARSSYFIYEKWFDCTLNNSRFIKK